jgi:hypothetical protein
VPPQGQTLTHHSAMKLSVTTAGAALAPNTLAAALRGGQRGRTSGVGAKRAASAVRRACVRQAGDHASARAVRRSTPRPAYVTPSNPWLTSPGGPAAWTPQRRGTPGPGGAGARPSTGSVPAGERRGPWHR